MGKANTGAISDMLAYFTNWDDDWDNGWYQMWASFEEEHRRDGNA